jgi:hypothetical protein
MHDISDRERLVEITESKKSLELVASCITKEVIVPLKGMTQILLKLMTTVKSSSQIKDIKMIFVTTQLLLAQVSLWMDKADLEKNRFLPNFKTYPIN